MSCLLDNGFSLGCRDSIGGISLAYIGNFDLEQTYVLNGDGDITSATGSLVSYYKFEQEIETGAFTQEGAFSTENGTVFYTQNLSLTFQKNDTDLRNTLIVLGQANLSVIVKDQRGELWLMGYQNGVRITAGSMNTGKAYGDLNGVTITLTGKEKLPAYRITSLSSFDIN